MAQVGGVEMKASRAAAMQARELAAMQGSLEAQREALMSLQLVVGELCAKVDATAARMVGLAEALERETRPAARSRAKAKADE